jgi:oligopeptide/dipeptide ABC transporter ATP-binding protein
MTAPLLQVRDLKTWFPVRRGILARTTGHVRAVDGVTFAVQAGETVGLVGESGCGKTTLGRTIMGLEPRRAGEIHLDGQPIWPTRHSATLPYRRRMQMIFQDPVSSLNPRLTVLEIITEGLLEHGLIRSRERTEAGVRLLQEVGMAPDVLHRYPHEFSGGQRQRLSIARAMALRPDLVICDEPVSALDVSVRAQVLNLLIDLGAAHTLSYLFISHDLGVIRHICSRVIVMYLGVVVESGPTNGIIDHPVHPYTRALISAVPIPFGSGRQRVILSGEIPSAANPPSGCRFHTRCPFAIPDCSRVVPPLEIFKPATGAAREVACLRKHDLAQGTSLPHDSRD